MVKVVAPSAFSGEAAEAGCKAVESIGTGDAAVLMALPPEPRAALADVGLDDFASCLAVAEDNSHYCESLPALGKDHCLAEWKMVHEFKALPKGASVLPLVASRFYEQCSSQFPKTVCDQMQEAMTTGTAAKCNGLPQPLGPMCEALVTGDASHCPSDGEDCRRNVTIVAKASSEGLEGFRGDSDPAILLAARTGRPACAPLFAKLQNSCGQRKP